MALEVRRARETSADVVTISTDPMIIVFSSEDLELPAVDVNVDVEVHTETGRWSATFFTLTNIETLVVSAQLGVVEVQAGRRGHRRDDRRAG